jgi:hypothetical protein
MIPKKLAPDLIRGGYRFSEKIMLEKSGRGWAAWIPCADPSWRRHMETGAGCRLHAAEFFAHAEREPERQAHLIGMAESWLRLAVQAERIEAMMDHARPVIPHNPNLDVE